MRSSLEDSQPHDASFFLISVTAKFGNFQRELPEWGHQMIGGREIGYIFFAVSLKQCKTGPRFLLNTNRKSHMGFQLVSKAMTLNVHQSRAMLHDMDCYLFSVIRMTES